MRMRLPSLERNRSVMYSAALSVRVCACCSHSLCLATADHSSHSSGASVVKGPLSDNTNEHQHPCSVSKPTSSSRRGRVLALPLAKPARIEALPTTTSSTAQLPRRANHANVVNRRVRSHTRQQHAAPNNSDHTRTAPEDDSVHDPSRNQTAQDLAINEWAAKTRECLTTLFVRSSVWRHILLAYVLRADGADGANGSRTCNSALRLARVWCVALSRAHMTQPFVVCLSDTMTVLWLYPSQSDASARVKTLRHTVAALHRTFDALCLRFALYVACVRPVATTSVGECEERLTLAYDQC